MSICQVSFCDRSADRATGGRTGYCFYHYRTKRHGGDPEATPLRPEGWRKHFFDHRYFEHVDSPNKAYLLGYFYADGCIENDYANPNAAVKWKKGNCHGLSYSGNEQVERIGRFLYSNPPNFFLHRKQERFAQLFNRPPQAYRVSR